MNAKPNSIGPYYFIEEDSQLGAIIAQIAAAGEDPRLMGQLSAYIKCYTENKAEYKPIKSKSTTY